MGVETAISETFRQYKNDEEILETSIVAQFRLKIEWITSGLWFGHIAGLGYGFFKLVACLDRIDSTHAASACTAIFGGAGLLAWIVVGSYLWFHGTEEMCKGWVSFISEGISDGYRRSRQIHQLRKEQKKREEFFKFYELYKNDENFRSSYNSQMSNKAESDEFLEKLNKKNE